MFPGYKKRNVARVIQILTHPKRKVSVFLRGKFISLFSLAFFAEWGAILKLLNGNHYNNTFFLYINSASSYVGNFFIINFMNKSCSSLKLLHVLRSKIQSSDI